MPYTFTLSEVIPATPEAIYGAWLDSRGHSAMTGSKATASADIGGAFTAWDGYISGRNVQLVPNTRIVQTWRTTAFTPQQQYSTVTVLLTPVPDGTRVTLTHANVPDDHKGYESGGWQDYYFTPMKAYFGEPAAEPKAAKAKATPKKAAPKKAAPKKTAKKAAARKAGAKKAAAKKVAAKKAKPKAAKAKTARRKSAKAKKAKAATRKTGARKAATRRTAKRPARSKKRK